MKVAARPVTQESGPCLFGFADEDYVGQSGKIIFLHGNPWSADDREYVSFLELRENLTHPKSLDAHSGQPDDVSPRQSFVVEGLDVFVDEGDLVAIGNQRGQKRQAGYRQIGSLAQERQGVFQPPIRSFETRVD